MAVPPRGVPALAASPQGRSVQLRCIRAAGVCPWAAPRACSCSELITVIQWFKLEGDLKITWFQPPCRGQGRLQLDRVAQSPIQPVLEHVRALGHPQLP